MMDIETKLGVASPYSSGAVQRRTTIWVRASDPVSACWNSGGGDRSLQVNVGEGVDCLTLFIHGEQIQALRDDLLRLMPVEAAEAAPMAEEV